MDVTTKMLSNRAEFIRNVLGAESVDYIGGSYSGGVSHKYYIECYGVQYVLRGRTKADLMTAADALILGAQIMINKEIV